MENDRNLWYAYGGSRMLHERMRPMLFDEIVRNEEVLEYYRRGNAILGVLGYTDHSTAHTRLVAEKTAEILRAFGAETASKTALRATSPFVGLPST